MTYPYVFEDPVTGMSRTYESRRLLSDAEVVGKARAFFGRDATLLSRPEPPKTPKDVRGRLTLEPRSQGLPQAPRYGDPSYGPPPPVKEPVFGGEQGSSGLFGEPGDPRNLERTAMGIGTEAVASSIPVLGLPRLMLRLLPRARGTAEALGQVAGGAGAGATSAAVGGRTESIPGEAAVGGAAGLLGNLIAGSKGAYYRHGPGSVRRMGDAMARDIERVGGGQTPVLKGLTTGASLQDWATSKFWGQNALNTLYDDAKSVVAGSLPPEVATKAAHAAAVGSPQVQQWLKDVNAIATQMGVKPGDPSLQPILQRFGLGTDPRPGLRIPAISREPISYEQALNDLKTMGRSFDAAPTAAGVQDTRVAWLEGWDQLRSELQRAGVPAPQIAAFDQMRKQYRMAILWKTLLEGGKSRSLVPVNLQRELAGSRYDLEKLAGSPEEFKRVADVVLRGKRDVHPVTGESVPSIRSSDTPGRGVARMIHPVLTPGTGADVIPSRGRVYLAPSGGPTRYIHAPEQPLPGTMGRGGRDILGILANLGRLLGVSEEPSK